MSEPLVSVILIGYNDAARISRAIDSVRSQTLHSIEIIVVDDASTDATSQIVTAVAEQDARIRYVQRTENSGGCSAPRNDGLALARAPWVMFCDSDDELDIHACANLLSAAEEWGAELVCGTAVRHDVGKDRDKVWRPDLHRVDRVVTSLDEEPDLLYDTISVNKIYSRNFLAQHSIMFPPGLLFEDQVFTLQCFLAARRIGILQTCVYIWNVDRKAEDVSITQGRMQQRNVVDRVEINRRMDGLLAASSDELRLAKAVKFLRHEGYLYLSTIGEHPDADSANALAGVFRDYVSGVDIRAFEHVRPALRVAFYGLLTSDMDLLRSAMRWERWASVVDTVVVADDERQFWRMPAARTADDLVMERPPSWWLDVTHLQLLDMPFSTRRYFHEFTELSTKGSRISTTIETTDYAGDLPADVSAQLVWSDRGGAVIASLPLDSVTEHASGRRVWRGAGAPSVHIRRALMRSDKGSVGVRIAYGNQVNVTAIRSIGAGVNGTFVAFPSIAFADRPAGAEFYAGERASVNWRPAGMAGGPVAWSRRLGNAARRRLGGPSSVVVDARGALLPGEFDLPEHRPVIAYLPVASAGGPRPWPLDLTAWDEALAEQCYLLAGGDIDESVPTRLWGSIRDARAMSLATVMQKAQLVITDDPALIDTTGPSLVFRPDEGARRYLLPPLPAGYPVIEHTKDLVAAVCEALEVKVPR
jgi:glycosyltransferase involved in cell wall biosynthesis